MLTKSIQEKNELFLTKSLSSEHINYTEVKALIPFLETLASLKKCGVVVYDLYTKDYFFVSRDWKKVFGFDKKTVNKNNCHRG